MDPVNLFLIAMLPLTMTIAALALVLIAVYVWRYNPAGTEAAYWEGFRTGTQDGYLKGQADGIAEGELAGRQAEFLANETFIQCPDCDHAVHVPVHVILEGETGTQAVRAEPDTSLLWLHMQNHTGKTASDGAEVPSEL
jgi:hypothetical protein